MNAKTTEIINEIGGTGKTTTAVNLQEGLVRKRYKILLFDLNPSTMPLKAWTQVWLK